MATITASGHPPEEPKNADFALVIDFKKGKESPTRVFTAATDFIKAFEALDRTLVQSIDSNIEPIMMLEDVEVGSLKIFLKNGLRSIDDQAIKKLDWKPIIGEYLVRAKYMILSWVERDDVPPSLQDLRRDLSMLARETDVRHLPDYSPPNPAELIESIKQVESGKRRLSPEDRVFIEAGDERQEISLKVSVDPDDLELLATRETIKTPPAPMILAVKKPDYLGQSKWDLRHGRRPISATIADVDFLSEFQNRKKDVRPGDALRCMVSIEMRYGYDNELISETYLVEQVIEILEDTAEQHELFDL